MIKIRLARLGKRNTPFYRIVATEKNRKREGKPIDILGFWDKGKEKIKINKNKLEKWQKRGARLTRAVEKLL